MTHEAVIGYASLTVLIMIMSSLDEETCITAVELIQTKFRVSDKRVKFEVLNCTSFACQLLLKVFVT